MAKKTETPAPTGQLNTWEAQLEKSANVAAKAAAKSVTRSFIGMGGKMTIDGADVPNNMLGGVVLEQVPVNLYYAKQYDPNNPADPDCYSFGKFDDEGNVLGVDTWDGRTELAPHKSVPAAARKHTDCATCPMNAFKSSPNGKGKACQNTRRAAIIPAGAMVEGKFKPFTKPEQIASAQISYLKVPLMSVKGLDGYVTTLYNAFVRPLWGMFTKVERVPDAQSQFVVTFSALGSIPNELMEEVYKRQQEAAAQIHFPFEGRAAVPAGKPSKSQRRFS